MDAKDKREIHDIVEEVVDRKVAPLVQDVGLLKTSSRTHAEELQRHGRLLDEHSKLLTDHARLLTTAQEAAFKALTSTQESRSEQDAALKSAIEIQNKAITDLRIETKGHLAKQDSALAKIAVETGATHTETKRQTVIIQNIATALAPRLVRQVLPYLIMLFAAAGAFYSGCETATRSKNAPAQQR